MTCDKLSVLLVDDHPVVRAGYRRLLEGSGTMTVREAASGEEAYQAYKDSNPQVVVMDLNMPGMGGIEAARRICSYDPDARVLVFSVHDTAVMLQQAMRVGATGYLTKCSAASEMVEAVRRVAGGERYVARELQPHVSAAEDREPLGELTSREFEIFKLIAEGHSAAQIADVLSISRNTAGVHRANIMRKLGLENTTQLIRLAIQCGVIEA